MQNYGKFIDLTFTTGTERWKIITPRKGIKPLIEIKGEVTGKAEISALEIRITNFYADKIQPGETLVSVAAGYEGNMSENVSGTVLSVYTEKTAPDKVTVITCAYADFYKWLNATVNLKLKEGFTLKEALTELSDALGFDAPECAESLAALTCSAPLYENGKAKNVIEQLKKAFPEAEFSFSQKKITAFAKDPAESVSSSAPVQIPFLLQVPQFSGGSVSLIAPWNPRVKPGSLISFPATVAKTFGDIPTFSLAVVASVQFQFSTTGEKNEMIVTATAKKIEGNAL